MTDYMIDVIIISGVMYKCISRIYTEHFFAFDVMPVRRCSILTQEFRFFILQILAFAVMPSAKWSGVLRGHPYMSINYKVEIDGRQLIFFPKSSKILDVYLLVVVEAVSPRPSFSTAAMPLSHAPPSSRRRAAPCAAFHGVASTAHSAYQSSYK